MARDLSLDPAALTRQLVEFLRSYAEDARADGFVLGLSGGIDSAVAAALAARAVGPEKVLGLLLPHVDSNPRDEEDARAVAEHLGMPVKRVDVTPAVDAVLAGMQDVEGVDRAVTANLKARARMLVNYAHANAMDRLVLGTGNKSELLTGYFTKYGDGGADVYPIGDLYKTQVRALARHLDLPSGVIEKPPSAGLYEGQTDEDELGITYADLDQVLAGFEATLTVDQVAAESGVPVAKVRDVERRLIASAHKRAPLVIPKVGYRTPGLDWREPRSRAPEPDGVTR